MDIYTLIVMGHVIGTILGTGGATVAELQIVRALRDKRVSKDESALMHVNYGMIRAGMAIILLSVIGMFWYSGGGSYLLSDPKYLTKSIMFIAIVINAIALHKRWVPLWLGASISFTSWWGATILGLAGELPYQLTTFLFGYVLAIFIVAAILHFLRYLTNLVIINKKNILLCVSLLLVATVVIMFVAYAIFRPDRPEALTKTVDQTEEVAILRELSSTVEYEVPNGSHTIKFTIETDDSGIIQAVTGIDVTDPGHQASIDTFSTTLTTTIKGRPLSELEKVDTVGTSSLTTEAFNRALTEIKTQL